jgi:FkbM family methyltransferase
MKLDFRDVLQRGILLYDVWDAATTKLILRNLSPGMLFIDIGANVGYFTLVAAQQVGQLGRVIAVEPNPLVAEQLRQNVARSGLSNAVVVQAACSDSNQRRSLYLANISGTGNTGQSSFSAQNARSEVSVDVECVTVDQLVEGAKSTRVDLVKIDVEGAEMSVLRGMTRTLTRFRPKLIIEINPERLDSFATKPGDVIGFIEGFGYRTGEIKEQTALSDYLFVPVEQSTG